MEILSFAIGKLHGVLSWRCIDNSFWNFNKKVSYSNATLRECLIPATDARVANYVYTRFEISLSSFPGISGYWMTVECARNALEKHVRNNKGDSGRTFCRFYYFQSSVHIFALQIINPLSWLKSFYCSSRWENISSHNHLFGLTSLLGLSWDVITPAVNAENPLESFHLRHIGEPPSQTHRSMGLCRTCGGY